MNEETEKEPIRVLLVGDCMLGRVVNEILEHEPPEYPWGDTLPIFEHADWRMCNLECVLSDRGTPWAPGSKAFHFRSAAKNAATLKVARINAVSLANNHVLDYGQEALFQMLEILDEAGIAHSGAGRNLAEASRPAFAEVRGRRLGLVAFTDNEPCWEATAARPGTFYVPVDLADRRAKHLLSLVGEHKQAADVLIVSAHWGSNWGYAAPKEHMGFAHALVDAGADLVFGHSSHVFRGIEFCGGRPIVYGAGDFVDDYLVDEIERNDHSLIYEASLQGAAEWRLRLYPTTIGNCQALRARRAEAEIIAKKAAELSAALGTPAEWLAAEQCLEIADGNRQEASKATAAAGNPGGRFKANLPPRES